MEADLDRDGKISFEEFTKMVENTDVSMSMTLGMTNFSVQPSSTLLTIGCYRPVLNDGYPITSHGAGNA